MKATTLLMTALLAMAPAVASAQTPTEPYPEDEPASADANDEKVQQAVQLGRAALTKFRDGAWQEAYEGFAQADALAHSPLFVTYMARCQVELGRPLAARRLFQRVVDEPLGDDPPEAFTRAKTQAQEGLTALAGTVPSLRVRVTGWRDGDRLQLDGEGVAIEEGETVFEAEPGEHRVALWRDGAEVAFEEVTLEAGSTLALALEAPEVEAPARPTAPAPLAPRAAPLVTPTSSSVPVAPLVTLGVGAVGMIVGGITGGFALKAAGEAEQDCEPGAAPDGGDLCPVANQDAHDRANLLATASTVSLALGAAAVVTGAVLVFTVDGDDDGPDVGLSAGPGGLSIHGRF